jgi:hypothetical protein
MTPENPEVTRFIELLESEGYDPREPTPMELENAYRWYAGGEQ